MQGLARFSTQRKKEVRAAEGGNDGVTLKKKKKNSPLNKTAAAPDDTLKHIRSNWPTDLQKPSIMHTDSSILDLSCGQMSEIWK